MNAPSTRSLVAGVNAMFRALETRRRPDERILDDPFAHHFAERDPRVTLLRMARFFLPVLRGLVRELQTAHCVRHRALDALVMRALDAGATQVVIVGAGYDMRAQRLGPSAIGARWFEVDHPATQRRKQALCAAHPACARIPVTRVAADLLQADLATSLCRTDFDANAPTCFVLEGLVHYLPPTRHQALLRALAHADTPRTVLLSFIRTEVYDQASPLFVRAVRILREVPRWHTTAHALGALATPHGFALSRTWTCAEQAEAFAPQARGRAAGLAQDVALLENSPSLQRPSAQPRLGPSV